MHGAIHVHNMAKAYNASVILHTDHCARKLLPWIDGLLDAGEEFYEKNGIPHTLLKVSPFSEVMQTS